MFLDSLQLLFSGERKKMFFWGDKRLLSKDLRGTALERAVTPLHLKKGAISLDALPGNNASGSS